jgi:hypothetical protein
MMNLEEMAVACCEVLFRGLPRRTEESGFKAGTGLTEEHCYQQVSFIKL